MNKRPHITPEMAASALQAIIFGKKVSDETYQARQAICRACDKKKTDKNSVDFCGMCGCSVAGTHFKLLNLCAYEETLRHGCKHPQRKFGKGWPRSE